MTMSVTDVVCCNCSQNKAANGSMVGEGQRGAGWGILQGPWAPLPRDVLWAWLVLAALLFQLAANESGS